MPISLSIWFGGMILTPKCFKRTEPQALQAIREPTPYIPVKPRTVKGANKTCSNGVSGLSHPEGPGKRHGTVTIAIIVIRLMVVTTVILVTRVIVAIFFGT